MTISERLSEHDFEKEILWFERQRNQWVFKQVIINHAGGNGVSETIPLEEYYRDRLAEKKYYSLKRTAENKRIFSHRDDFRPRTIRCTQDSQNKQKSSKRETIKIPMRLMQV